MQVQRRELKCIRFRFFWVQVFWGFRVLVLGQGRGFLCASLVCTVMCAHPPCYIVILRTG